MQEFHGELYQIEKKIIYDNSHNYYILSAYFTGLHF